jgi:alanine racemase
MTTSPSWVEIDVAAIAHNLDVVRAGLGGTARLCGVVKADAYGHGITAVLPVVTAGGVDAVGVTSNEEAAAARELGFPGRILRLRPALRDEILEGVAFGIEEWVGGGEHARVVIAAARSLGRPVRVHLSLNSTGLSRDGMPWGDPRSVRDARELVSGDGLRLVGVCTHFPCEDADDVRAGTRAFEVEADEAERAVGLPARALERHCATSYAALTVPASRMDLVRIGAALYGDTSADVPGLRSAMRLVARIAAVNEYPAGGTVGYERTRRLDRPSRLAVVPIGYADGYQRLLSGRAEVLIGGSSAPVIDLLAMNSLIVDVTDLPAARIGDEVVLYGRQGAAEIRAADLERASGTIAAGLYAAWGRLHPRVVVNAPAAEPALTS